MRFFHFYRKSTVAAISCALLVALSACSKVPSLRGEAKYPTGVDRSSNSGDIYAESDSIFGEGGWKIFGGDKKGPNDGSSGIGVNSFLWRASLDTISFMPLASADPFGGVIITDWYEAEEKKNERFKINIFILDRQLKSSGIKAKVFRQVRKSGRWVDTKVAKDTVNQLEESILTRARQLRVASLKEE